MVVDEVQRVPELLQVVHDLLERPDAPRFVLTGSSARKLRRGGVNLLAGRATLRTLHPFMAAELPAFDLRRALQVGLVPLVVGAADAADTLAAYATVYLEQEVVAEGLVRQVGNFARFLEAVSFSHASLLNLSNVARDAFVPRKAVEGFLEVLEDLLVAYRLPVFTKRAQRATVAHPKFYFFDAGVYRSLRPTGPLDRPSEIDGAALEGVVAQRTAIACAVTTCGDCWLFETTIRSVARFCSIAARVGWRSMQFPVGRSRTFSADCVPAMAVCPASGPGSRGSLRRHEQHRPCGYAATCLVRRPYHHRRDAVR